MLGVAVELAAPGADAVSTVLGLLGGVSEIAFLGWLLVKGAPAPLRERVLVP